MSGFRPRPAQSEALAYLGGKLAVAAAPGSGKTHTLAVLAAKLVSETIAEGQEVLVVTLVNSAVDGLKRRISQAIRQETERAVPGLGYRVRTLHGLAHDLVRERPALVGLAEDFSILDEIEAAAVLRDAVEAWLRSHPDSVAAFLRADLDEGAERRVRRREWPELVYDIASSSIRQAKDLGLSPQQLQVRLAGCDAGQGLPGGRDALRLAWMAAEIYADYQRSLSYRGAVDFDDLVRLAFEALQADPVYLERVQQRWRYVLEDEAQDSSRAQERLLRLLSARHGNWVRVGDTNQAIYETFTTASPRLLREFMEETGVRTVQFREAGRSQQAILDLANLLVDWSLAEHPLLGTKGGQEPGHRAEGAVFLPMSIQATGPADSQANPPADRSAVRLIMRPYSPHEECEAVSQSLLSWLATERARPNEQQQTCAVLAPRTEHGARLAESLKRKGIPFVELLRTSGSTRETVALLADLLEMLADPTSGRRLAAAFRGWASRKLDNEGQRPQIGEAARLIGSCLRVEAYLWPRVDQDWMTQLGSRTGEPTLALLRAFREVACRWHRASNLPVDQAILTLAADLFSASAELALAHKVGLVLRDLSEARADLRWSELAVELRAVANNSRRFLGFSGEDVGFEPPPGVVTIATMHKAKGLEWDRVYLTSVNCYDFPAGQPGDVFQDEKWYVRDGLNLRAEALAQLAALAQASGEAGFVVAEGPPTLSARWDYVAERTRLLYVGITRARRELIITWNTGTRSSSLQAAAALIGLQAEWEAR